MAHDTDINEKIHQIEELIDQLEAGGMAVNDAGRLHQDGHMLLDEARTLLSEGEGDVVERNES